LGVGLLIKAVSGGMTIIYSRRTKDLLAEILAKIFMAGREAIEGRISRTTAGRDLQ